MSDDVRVWEREARVDVIEFGGAEDADPKKAVSAPEALAGNHGHSAAGHNLHNNSDHNLARLMFLVAVAPGRVTPDQRDSCVEHFGEQATTAACLVASWMFARVVVARAALPTSL
jgi:hypothetical protein